MKSSMLICLVLLLTSTLSIAKTSQIERAIYSFDFANFEGAVKELKISFNNVDSEENMTATTKTTLKNGTKINGQFVCQWTENRKSIDCNRDDNGGQFTFVTERNKFKLTFTRFHLNAEGTEEEVAVKSRYPGKTDEVVGKKD